MQGRFLTNDDRARLSSFPDELLDTDRLAYYITEALRQLRAEGHPVDDDAIPHLSPAMYAHVNKHGKYRFDVDRLQVGQLRPLRQPTAATP